MQQGLSLTATAPLSLTALFINLGVGIILSILLRLHFKYFSSALTNRRDFQHVCPFVLLTTILIITIVKSSLALSLGLVGALSIVRFRTPIKEPEELAYLFIAIAMGLGLGADQTLPTVLASLVILVTMALFKWTRRDDSQGKNLYLSIDIRDKESLPELFLNKLNELISRHVMFLTLGALTLGIVVSRQPILLISKTLTSCLIWWMNYMQPSLVSVLPSLIKVEFLSINQHDY